MPVFVITGANRGLGLEFVRQLSADPSNTIIAATRSLSRDLSALESLKSNPGKLHILECDTGSQESITAFCKQVSSVLGGPDKKIDFLLNNAGINANSQQTSLTLTADNLSEHINVNVAGPAKTVQLLESHLQSGSVVMNTTSGLGSLWYNSTRETVNCTAYAISKAAVNMLTVHQAIDLKPKGVLVVCVDPGWVKTDMGGKGAVLEKEESIGGMLKCLRGLTPADSGKFFVYDGSQKAW